MQGDTGGGQGEAMQQQRKRPHNAVDRGPATTANQVNVHIIICPSSH